MDETVEGALLIEELKAQRNAVSDQLAMLGALVVTYRRKIEELEKKINETAPPTP